jgi:nickel-dependent lactate racemase
VNKVKKKMLAMVTVLAVGFTVSASSAASADHGKTKAREQLSSFLSGLVSNGTINQSQADAIIKAAESAAEAAKSVMKQKHNAFDAVITSTLGISLDTLKSRLKAGESLAAIAGDKKDALISALIAEINKQIDAALAAGKSQQLKQLLKKPKPRSRLRTWLIM